MFRRKTILYISCLILFWFIVIFKLYSSISTKDSEEMKELKISSNASVNIKYFKKFYIKSIKDITKNGVGENGEAVKIDEKDSKEYELRFFLHKFNELASSRISLLRSLPDKRRSSCFKRSYPTNLPTASVVIIYHNEAFSTLARTVHTALSRSPYHLIKEIILVDDFSDYQKFPHLLQKLNDHFKNIPKVVILRSEKRIGLTVARLRGAARATGDVLIFLDSHCEAFDGWLEPLLDDIKTNPRAAITPVIEVIDLDTFAVNKNIITQLNVGTFTWKADFTWFVPKDQSVDSKIIRSPTMAGGLFAIGREFFFESGSYDDKMTYWGGENIEMSFRLWMCADGIYSDPCSVVGHVFRKNSPHDMAKNSVFYNKLRAVEVWMDEYKSIVYSKIGIKQYDDKAGSLDERLQLRKNLQCKSFKWYMTNVCQQMRIPGSSSPIKNSATNMCLDSEGTESEKPAALHGCHGHGGNQAFEIDKEPGIILIEDVCLDLSKGFEGAIPSFYPCHFSGGNQKWLFIENDHIKHSLFGTCLQVNRESKRVEMGNCDTDNEYQKWEFTFSKTIVHT